MLSANGLLYFVVSLVFVALVFAVADFFAVEYSVFYLHKNTIIVSTRKKVFLLNADD